MLPAEDVRGDVLSATTSTVARVRQLPTRLIDTSLPQLVMSPTFTSSDSHRVRHSASDTGAHILTTPSSYRASFSRLQPVDIPDADNCRHSNVVSHHTISDIHRRSQFLVVPANASQYKSIFHCFNVVQLKLTLLVCMIQYTII